MSTLSPQTVDVWSGRLAGLRRRLGRWWVAAPTPGSRGSSHRGSTWREAFLGGLGLWLAVRLAVTAFALFTVATSARARPIPVPRSFASLFFQWDSSYYVSIAAHGYFARSSPLDLEAFFPGYPLASRLVADVLSGTSRPDLTQIVVGMWAAAAVPAALAAVGIWKLAADRFGARVAAGATFLVVAGPYSVFLSASYPEALFLALAVFAWYHAMRGRWVVAGVLAAGASLTRIDGLFLSAALGVLFVQAGGPAWRARVSRGLALTVVGVSTFAGYFVYLFAVTGRPLAWFDAEREGWHRRFTVPWMSAADTVLAATARAASSTTRIQAWLEIVFAVAAVVGAVELIRRRWWGSAVLVTTTLASLMTSTTFLSLSRECLLLFPLALLLASTRDLPGRTWIFRGAVCVAVFLFAFNTHQFVLGLWAQ